MVPMRGGLGTKTTSRIDVAAKHVTVAWPANKPMKLTAAFGARSLSAIRWAATQWLGDGSEQGSKGDAWMAYTISAG